MGMGLPLFLRKSLDEQAVSLCAPTIHALAALLVVPADEVALDRRKFLLHGLHVPFLCPFQESSGNAYLLRDSLSFELIDLCLMVRRGIERGRGKRECASAN